MASHEDPFLEFEPEPAVPAGRVQPRPAPDRLRPAPEAPWPAPVAAPPPPEAAPLRDGLDPWRRVDPAPVEPARPGKRGISPAVAFAVGIAGLAAAATAFYQLNQALAERTVPIASPNASPAANGGDDGIAGSTPGPAASEDPSASTTTSAPEPTPEAAAPAAAAVPTGFGWVRFDTSLELAVLESGRTIGSTGAGPVRLPVGIHSLVLVSNAYNVRTPVRVSVTADRTTRTSVLLPMGSVSINALPWAEVWIDGKSVGLTPMANLAVPVGPREIVWRHPQLGERRQTVAVRAKVPVQVGVDFGR